MINDFETIRNHKENQNVRADSRILATLLEIISEMTCATFRAPLTSVANALHLSCGSKSENLAIYGTEDGKRPFKQWLDSLRDKVAVARINARLTRVELGNFGDAKPVGGGVMELRLVFWKWLSNLLRA